MSAKGVKRASPGAEEEKNPLGDVDLSDEDAVKLQELQRSYRRVELAIERSAAEKMQPVYEKRRPVVKAIAKFWPVALMNHEMFAIHCQHNLDQVALAYLEDLWVVRHPKEFRAFTLEFHFKENPFFTNTLLKKEYKYVQPAGAQDGEADENSVTDAMFDFSWERDVEPQVDWKDDAHNLTKLYPRVADAADEDDLSDSGSFFNFFELADDPLDLGVNIAHDVFPEAIDYFLGEKGGQEIDSDDEDEEEDEENEEEIDLEKPRVKKRKY
ncbi:hypothetical protein PHLGIDRAFT_26985 [Phlebiopsis gigantea 11061_1 CR5-6]|uniref:Nucleosome assembly protein n=1 Tax=Phlebiopsis gigantea (strain 11061_1 CR5-6) TaxID=745531 RepID=A0A0C3P9U2_PHLG1|nr:hypothetical protein PHLGIDRAFT_26985 [Phlebiopsis gigantea 11061_1 CR5-6]